MVGQVLTVAAQNGAGRADPGAISGAVAGVSFLAGLAGATARSKHPYPRPGSSGEEIRRRDDADRVSARRLRPVS